MMALAVYGTVTCHLLTRRAARYLLEETSPLSVREGRSDHAFRTSLGF